eukprot:TRINITY_DN18294_c0_g1_i1.p1 TRINITY_DN18294_c0_g1~~TRINITY_DN18294_c0_g1_i1.p1  ORF type:complete len:434 (+),score=58.23 TRINITY_DN18294_c0_g1_i1:50-1303(+)
MSIMTIGLRTNRTVFVSNVSEDVGEGQLKEFLSSFGDVEEMAKVDGSGVDAVWRVVYGQECDAKHALLVNGTVLMGVPVEVKADPSSDPFGHDQAAAEAELQRSNALVLAGQGTGTFGGVDALTMAAVQATQAGMNMSGVPGAGITPDLVEMVKLQPSLANTLVPMLKANTNHTAAELGLLSMVSEFHKQRAMQEAELKQKEEQAALQREVDELRAKQEKLKKRRRRKRSDSYSSSSSASTPQRRRKSESTTPPPQSNPSGAPVYPTDASYVSPTPTNHLYIVFPSGARLPPLAGIRTHFETLGNLTDLKVSKSKSCVFASMSPLPQTAVDTLKQVSELAQGQFNYAVSPYTEYLAKDSKEKSKDKDDRNDDRRERRDSRDRKDKKDRKDRRERDYDRRGDRRRRRSSTPRDRRRRR